MNWAAFFSAATGSVIVFKWATQYLSTCIVLFHTVGCFSPQNSHEPSHFSLNSVRITSIARYWSRGPFVSVVSSNLSSGHREQYSAIWPKPTNHVWSTILLPARISLPGNLLPLYVLVSHRFSWSEEEEACKSLLCNGAVDSLKVGFLKKKFWDGRLTVFEIRESRRTGCRYRVYARW